MNDIDIPKGYTPGPWNWYPASKMYPNGSDYDYGHIVWAEGRGEVSQTPGLNSDAEDEANARLISLAPEMAEEIVRLTEEVERLRAALEWYSKLPDDLEIKHIATDRGFGSLKLLGELARLAIKEQSHD